MIGYNLLVGRQAAHNEQLYQYIQYRNRHGDL